jgi:hypothetical protein
VNTVATNSGGWHDLSSAVPILPGLPPPWGRSTEKRDGFSVNHFHPG